MKNLSINEYNKDYAIGDQIDVVVFDCSNPEEIVLIFNNHVAALSKC